MPTSPSPDGYVTFHDQLPYHPARAARAAVRKGVPVPAHVAAQLEAMGINASELEARLIQNMEFIR